MGQAHIARPKEFLTGCVILFSDWNFLYGEFALNHFGISI